jgi:WhiB family redox-sensing transcriptional regulator
MTGDIATITKPLSEWIHRAACRGLDTELFYPEAGEPTAMAREVCDSCPVSVQCLQHAITNREQYGIWGGTSVRKRRNASLALENLRKRIEYLEIMKLEPKERRARLKKRES